MRARESEVAPSALMKLEDKSNVERDVFTLRVWERELTARASESVVLRPC